MNPNQRIELPSHRVKVALLQPQIAPNTGNIARLCVATGTELHLVRPLGFVLSDRNLKRSAMDYWSRLKLTVHNDMGEFLTAVAGSRLWLFTSKAGRGLWETRFNDGDWLVLGNETRGIDGKTLATYPDRAIRIPQSFGGRCLNLSTAAGIGLYEALRQICTARPHDPVEG